MIRAVLDTNSYISAYFWKGKQDDIVWLAARGQIQIIVSHEIMAELASKLRKKFRINEGKIERHMRFIRNLVIFTEPAKIPNIVKKDPDDDKIIATAIAGNVEYIVTGDRHLLELKQVKGIKILNSAEFLEKTGLTST